MNIIFHTSVLLLLLNLPPAKSADSIFTVMQSEIFKINWINQIKDLDKISGDVSIFKKIFNTLTGEQSDRLIKPVSVYAGESNRMLILDQGGRQIISVDIAENEYSTTTTRSTPSLVDLVYLPDGTLLYTDSRLENVYSMDQSNQEIRQFAPSYQFDQPTGIAYNSKDSTIWIIETAAHRLSVFDVNASLISQYGGRGKEPGKFNYPTFIWIDINGFVYIVDSMNFRIQILNSSGEIVSVFGEIGDASGYFARPKGIATDSFGNIYIVDGLFHNVQIFDREGNFLERFGEHGSARGQFWMPTGIYIDANNRIYIADTYNGRVQVFQIEERN